jgi:hypothetical protein
VDEVDTRHDNVTMALHLTINPHRANRRRELLPQLFAQRTYESGIECKPTLWIRSKMRAISSACVEEPVKQSWIDTKLDYRTVIQWLVSLELPPIPDFPICLRCRQSIGYGFDQCSWAVRALKTRGAGAVHFVRRR